MKLVTGVSTDMDFVKQVNEHGANLTIGSTPNKLLESLQTDESLNITYDSDNETIVGSVNRDSSGDGFDVVFRTFKHQGNVTLGVEDGVSLSDDFWELDDDESGVNYHIKDVSQFEVVLDDIKLDRIGYYTDIGSFGFDVSVLASLVQKFGYDLKDCPVSIKAPAGVFVKDGKPSNAIDIQEVFQTEHLPNWVVDIINYTINFDTFTDDESGTYTYVQRPLVGDGDIESIFSDINESESEDFDFGKIKVVYTDGTEVVCTGELVESPYTFNVIHDGSVLFTVYFCSGTATETGEDYAGIVMGA